MLIGIKCNHDGKAAFQPELFNHRGSHSGPCFENIFRFTNWPPGDWNPGMIESLPASVSGHHVNATNTPW